MLKLGKSIATDNDVIGHWFASNEHSEVITKILGEAVFAHVLSSYFAVLTSTGWRVLYTEDSSRIKLYLKECDQNGDIVHSAEYNCDLAAITDDLMGMGFGNKEEEEDDYPSRKYIIYNACGKLVRFLTDFQDYI